MHACELVFVCTCKIYSCKNAYVYTGISLISDPAGKMTKGGNTISVSYTL